MKANGAPEKIYIPTAGNELHYHMTCPNNDFQESVEYIRTDVFMKKACEFFGEHLWEYIDVKNANCDTFINIDGDKLKEDFKKYMKGE